MGLIMCCTTNQTNKKNFTIQKTKIFTKEKMLQEAEQNKDIEALFFEYENLKFCVLFTKDYFASAELCHLAFHAMSRGLEAYTETGYKSNFVHRGEDVGAKDVEDFFKVKLNEVGIDLDNPKPFLLSDVGGVANVEQPSLF